MSFNRLVLLTGSAFLSVTFVARAADKIQVYRVPKEKEASGLAAGHQANDGHDHGAHAGGNPHGMRAMPKVTYTTPEGWREAGAGDMRVAGFSITGTNGQSAQVAVTPLPGFRFFK